MFSIRQSGVTDIVYGFSYESGLNGRLDRIVAGKDAIYINHDKLGRYTGRTVNYEGNKILDESIEYKQVNEDVKLGSETRNLDRQSNLPSQISYSEGDKDYIEYDYDASGNITEINKNGKLIKYTYDSADRLIREDNKELNESYFYTYDNNGNITKKEKCRYTTDSEKVGTVTVINYTYNGNKLTLFGSESCTYDSIGNPITYRGKTATWKGRQLQSYGNTSFGYDGRGRRIYKNGERVYYYDFNDRLVSGNGLDYFYDHIGVAGFRYNGTYYTYKRDIQNNITAILDSNGNIVVEYKYDAWGNHTVSGEKATTIGAINPFRYRSYFYDIETGLYYLQTRYYDPEVGRFLNMDSVTYADTEATDGLNLYAYCGNDPINYYDPFGSFMISIGLAIGTLAKIGIAAAVLGWLEYTYHPIQNAANAIGNATADIFSKIQIGSSAISNGDLSISNDLDRYDIDNYILSSSWISSTADINILFAEHRKKRPSTRGKHEKGQRRKGKDKPGGEKGDKNRPYRRGGKHTNKFSYIFDYFVRIIL